MGVGAYSRLGVYSNKYGMQVLKTFKDHMIITPTLFASCGMSFASCKTSSVK